MYEKRKLTKSFNTRLSKEDYEALEKVATQLKCDMAALVRFAIRKHVIEAKKEMSKHPEVWGK